MASKKIDELTNLTSLANDDLLVAYDISEPSSEKTKKISKTNAFNGLSVDGHTHSDYLPLTGGNLSGDLTVGGNLTVTGTQFIANVETIEVEDNLMLLNKNESGAGVTAGTAGLEIERGTATNYKFLFDEPTDTFRVGMEGSLQPVATREDSPISSGIAIWNDTLKRFDTMASINGMEAHGNEYHTSTFITASDLTGLATETYVDTVSGALNTKVGLKEDAFSKNTAFNKNFGTGSSDVCVGNDARLSDARTPTTHTHDDRYYTESEVDTISGALNSAKLDLAGGNISGNLTVGGDFTVQGENFIADTQTVLVEDNLLVINKNEVGAGVTAGEAGIEVERGSEANYQFLFDETQDNFRVGISGSLQAVATRQDAPTQSGVAYWNDTDKRFDTMSGFTVYDIVTNDDLTNVFSNKYEVFTTSGTDRVTTDFDLIDGAMSVYVDGVRQHASSFTFSSPRTIILDDTVASGTAIAVIAMEIDAVQSLADKVNVVVSGTTNNLVKLTSTGDIADAGVQLSSSAPSVGDTFIYNGSIFVPSMITRPNIIINGGMNIWQRQVTFTSPASLTKLADRWSWGNGSSAAVTISKDDYSSFGSIAGEPYRSSLNVNVTTADSSVASTDYAGLSYNVEGYDMIQMIGRTCTLSFTAWSTLGGTYCIKFGNTGSDRSLIKEYTKTAGTWEKHTITFIMHDTTSGGWDYSTGKGLFIFWNLMCGSSFHTTKDVWQSGNYLATSNQTNLMATIGNKFYLTNVKLEVGDIATRFEQKSFAEELVLCQRYYEKSYRSATYAGASANEGRNIGIRGNGSANWFFTFTTTKRIPGGVTIYDPGAGGAGNVRRFSDNNPYACSVVNDSVNGFEINAHSSILVGENYGVQWTCDVEI